MNRKQTLLSLDAILFITLISTHLAISGMAWLVPQNTASNGYLVAGLWRLGALPAVAAILTVALIVYIVADILGGRYSYPCKLSVVWLTIGIFAIMIAATAVYMRHSTAPHLYAHDGLIQTEEAAKFLISGKNPYAENYLNTPMALWVFEEANLKVNPALYHLPYTPLLILVTVPFHLISNAVLGWFDLRFVFIPLFTITLLMIQKSVKPKENKFAALAFVGLNPMFVSFFVEGRNDVFLLFWLVLAIVLLEKGYRTASIIAFALACAAKQTAWLFIPFYALYLLQPNASRTLRELFVELAVKLRKNIVLVGTGVAVFGIIMLPFVFWDARAFYEDVFLFQSGLLPDGYPIRGLGFSNLVLALGWVESNTSAFPFGLFQLLFGIPTLAYLWLFQLKDNNASRMWLAFGLFFLVVSFFSRAFNDNYFGFAVTLLAMGAFWKHSDPETRDSTRSTTARLEL